MQPVVGVTKTEPLRKLVWEPFQLPSIRVSTLRKPEMKYSSVARRAAREAKDRTGPIRLT